jgi:molybdopterin/thiamine biosynthesis adenylyltransferase/rhodanese-related sulfurtransferase
MKRKTTSKDHDDDDDDDDDDDETPRHHPPQWYSRCFASSSSSSSSLSADDEKNIERYLRQMRLPLFNHHLHRIGSSSGSSSGGGGRSGQELLNRAVVFIAGAGGLGCPAILYLAGAGVGALVVCDGDVVEKSNLHRQICHRDEDATTTPTGKGEEEDEEEAKKKNKAESAIRAAKSLNPTVKFRAIGERVNEKNAMELLRDADVVLDCTDNQRARYVLSDACAKLRTPLVSGASVGVEGQLVVYNESRRVAGDGNEDIDAERGPCLRCAYPSPPPADECGSCAEQGVLNVAPGIVGTFQALECIRILLSGQCRYRGKEEEKTSSASSSAFPYRPLGLMTLFDFVQNPSRPTTCVKVKRRKDCLVCATSETRDAFAIESYDYDAFVNGGSAQRCTNNGTEDNKGEQSNDDERTPSRITCKELAQLLVENSIKSKNTINSKASSQEQNKHQKTNNVLLFDVRNEIEFSIAALKDAINYPFVEEEDKKNAMETITNVVVSAIDEIDGKRDEKEVAEVAEVDVIAFICRRGNDSQLARERFKQEILNGGDVAKNKRRTLTIEENCRDTTQTKKKSFYFDVGRCQIVDVIGGLRQWKHSIDSTFPNLD